MKKFLFFAVMASVALVSCNNSAPKLDAAPATAGSSEGGLKIAYVEVDSLMTQYDFAKDYSVAAVNNFQQKINNNGFQSREQAASVQAAIERQQRDLQELQARLENELASETAKFNEALRDSLQNFLKQYNKDKQFDLILSKAGDNILMGNQRLDITADVINGLNKHYKPAAKKADEQKTDEKK